MSQELKAMRLAALPVGAASAMVRPACSARVTRVRRVWVLPQPGPPVRIDTGVASAVRTACCSSVSPPGAVRARRQVQSVCSARVGVAEAQDVLGQSGLGPVHEGEADSGDGAEDIGVFEDRCWQGFDDGLTVGAESVQDLAQDRVLQDVRHGGVVVGEEVAGAGEEDTFGQVAVASGAGLGEGVEEGGLEALIAVFGDADGQGDAVGGLESDAVDVAAQLIRHVADDVHGAAVE